MLRNIVEPNLPVNVETLRFFALRNNIELPMSYEKFLLSTNGGQPEPAAFDIHGLEHNPAGVVQAFFGLNARIQSEDLELNLAELSGEIPAGILPIAGTDWDDFLILDLRFPGSPVRFWDRRSFWGTHAWRESDLYPVSCDFDSLLRDLHDF